MVRKHHCRDTESESEEEEKEDEVVEVKQESTIQDDDENQVTDILPQTLTPAVRSAKKKKVNVNITPLKKAHINLMVSSTSVKENDAQKKPMKKEVSIEEVGFCFSLFFLPEHLYHIYT